jgi:hypothetical protein
MTHQTAVDWPTCDEPGCIGIRLPRGDKCLAHATARRRTLALRRLHQTGEIDARGIPITEALLEQILAAAPHDTTNHSTFATARFNQATFQGNARFDGASFQGDAGFTAATFQGTAWFTEATFQGTVWFDGAPFQGVAWFTGATFQQDARFIEATFQDGAWFTGATFGGHARFEKATFGGDAWFTRATFGGHARFDEVTFGGDVWLSGATFQDFAGFGGTTFQDFAGFGGTTFQAEAWFKRATFQADAGFDQATFQGETGFAGVIARRNVWFLQAKFDQARQLGPLLVYGLLRLDAAHFAQVTLIEASSCGLSCQRTRFPAGVQLRLRGAHVVLDDTDLPSPSLLTGVDTLSDARLARREQRLVQAVRRLAPAAAEEFSEWPRLLSVQGANLAGLGVANIDLAHCRFARAHNLDKLRFEAEVSFAAAPARLPWDWRQVLAEERAWRAAQSSLQPTRWAAADWWPAWLHEPYGTEWPRLVEPAQLVGLYRALRKAREDAKDEPGAADFYYGEMEMRRHARRGRTGGASRGRVERGVLTAYWLVSGYGLRAWRALAALAVVLVAFAGLLVWGGGYPPARPAPATTAPSSTAAASSTAPVADRSLLGALLYGARTIIGLNPTPPPPLTRFGEALLIAVRVLGPLLLGLALLALRGRVKR